MEKSKSYIGLVLEENLQQADSTVRAYERVAIGIEKVAVLYEALEICEFSKEVLQDVLSNRTKTIQGKFLEIVETDLRNAGHKNTAIIDAHKKASLDLIKPLADAASSLLILLDLEISKNANVDDFMNYVNDNGRLKVDKALKLNVIDRHSIKVNNKGQEDYYKAFLSTKEHLEKLVKIAKSKGVRFHSIADEFSSTALLQIDNINDTIKLNPYMIRDIQ